MGKPSLSSSLQQQHPREDQEAEIAKALGKKSIQTCEHKHSASSNILSKAQGRSTGRDAGASGSKGHLLHESLADAIDNVQAGTVQDQLMVLCLSLQRGICLYSHQRLHLLMCLLAI